MANVKTLLTTGMLAVGAVLLGYAVFFSDSDDDPSGWVPVNDRLQAALTSSEPPKVTTQPTDAPVPPKAAPDATQSAPPAPTQSAPPAPAQSAPPTPAQSAPQAATASLLDLNAAAQQQLEELPGIGPSKAKAIIAYREQHGAFKSVEDLLNVKGIGPKMLEKLAAHVTVQAVN